MPDNNFGGSKALYISLNEESLSLITRYLSSIYFSISFMGFLPYSGDTNFKVIILSKIDKEGSKGVLLMVFRDVFFMTLECDVFWIKFAYLYKRAGLIKAQISS